MRDLLITMAIIAMASYVIFIAGCLTGRAEYRREMEEKGWTPTRH